MNILALDLGTTTGWATSVGDQIFSGTVSFSVPKAHRFEGGGIRYVRFQEWLTDTKRRYPTLQTVVFEAVRRHVSTDSAHVYGGFLATLTSWCEQHQIPYQGIPVKTIKKATTGKGNATKALMIQAIQAQGFHPKDDNEADALALLLLMRGLHV